MNGSRGGELRVSVCVLTIIITNKRLCYVALLSVEFTSTVQLRYHVLAHKVLLQRRSDVEWR